MLVILFTLLPPPPVLALKLSLCLILISILTWKSPLEVVQTSFPLLLYATVCYLLYHCSHGRDCCWGNQNTLKHYQPAPPSMDHSSIFEESWNEGCNQVQTLFTICWVLQSMLGFCLCSQWLDDGGLEGDDMVWKDQNLSPGVRWLHISLEKVSKWA